MGSNGEPAARVNGETAKRPTGDGNRAPALALAPPAATSASVASIQLQARVDQTLYAFRLRGHLLAQLDPLGRPRPPISHAADLAMVSNASFTPDESSPSTRGSRSATCWTGSAGLTAGTLASNS
jgi:2-oxoglutarate dehydrogenase E1 component